MFTNRIFFLIKKLFLPAIWREKSMKSILVTSIILLFFIFSSAENAKIDSLLRKLKEVPDIEKIQVYDELCRSYQYISSDKVIENARNILKIANKYNYKSAIANANLWLGVGSFLKGSSEEAKQYVLFAHSLYSELDDNKGKMDCYKLLGHIQFNYSQFHGALKNFIKVLEYNLEIEDANEIAKSYLNIGLIYAEIDYVEKARDYYILAHNKYREIDDIRGIAYCMNNIGLLELANSNYDTAINYFNRSIDFKNRIEDKVGISNSKANIADVLFLNGDIDESLEIYTEIFLAFSITLSDDIYW